MSNQSAISLALDSINENINKLFAKPREQFKNSAGLNLLGTAFSGLAILSMKGNPLIQVGLMLPLYSQATGVIFSRTSHTDNAKQSSRAARSAEIRRQGYLRRIGQPLYLGLAVGKLGEGIVRTYIGLTEHQHQELEQGITNFIESAWYTSASFFSNGYNYRHNVVIKEEKKK